MKLRLYIKSEPSGEYRITYFPIDDCKKIDINEANLGLDESEIDSCCDYDNSVFDAYGIATYPEPNEMNAWGMTLIDDEDNVIREISKEEIEIIIKNSTIKKYRKEDILDDDYYDGYYCLHTDLDKYSVELEIEVGEEFNPEKLKLGFIDFYFSDKFRNSYGIIANTILDTIEYDGEDYSSEYLDNLVDRHSIIGESLIFKKNNNDLIPVTGKCCPGVPKEESETKQNYIIISIEQTLYLENFKKEDFQKVRQGEIEKIKKLFAEILEVDEKEIVVKDDIDLNDVEDMFDYDESDKNLITSYYEEEPDIAMLVPIKGLSICNIDEKLLDDRLENFSVLFNINGEWVYQSYDCGEYDTGYCNIGGEEYYIGEGIIYKYYNDILEKFKDYIDD